MAGMFDFLPQPTYRDLAYEENAQERLDLERARLSLGDAAAYTAAQGGRMVGKGLGQLAGGALGVDTRSKEEVNAAKIEEVKAAVARELGGIDPADPKFADRFYPAVIRALIAQKMPFEAAQVQKEYQAQRIGAQKAATGQAAVDQRRADADERNKLARAKLSRMGSELVQLTDEIQRLQDELLKGDPADPGYKTKEIAIENLIRALDAKVKAAGGSVKLADAGDKVVVLDAQGNTVREITKGAKPMSEDQAADNRRAQDKQDKAKDGKQLTSQQVAAFAAVKDQLQSLARLAGTFRADFSGGFFSKIGTALGLEDQVQSMQRLYGDNRDAVAWWEAYARIMTAIRKAIYGATLTAGEKSAFAQIKASIGDDPQQVIRTLRQQAEAAAQELNSYWTTQKHGGFAVDNLEPDVRAAQSAAEAMPAAPQPAPSAARRAPRAPAAAPAAPAAAPAAGKQRRRFNPATGELE
jgi:hypothetical protein